MAVQEQRASPKDHDLTYQRRQDNQPPPENPQKLVITTTSTSSATFSLQNHSHTPENHGPPPMSRSPLKDARLARRLLTQEASSSPPNTSEAHEQQSMSSSPPTQGVMDESRSRPKRSMSPAPDTGTLERHLEPPPEQETKRAKKESDVCENHEPSNFR
ncbi:hypothetical protein M378DRAFT_15265 [Amanita muscaria Koide BX008]|uniref:Uncharacterized protein n=1 Tax=Amanita muscaria (strain Koide BX008) TaxID=946122 RepID=A0A0C2S7N5_AMAMK|nr:hypothetical protein M378DRAFT_15265 [Amanita muscaria Koide BX008]